MSVSPVLPRGAAAKVLEALSDTPVVVVNGPRQAGKTTLVNSLRYPGSSRILTLDDAPTRDAAAADPRAFVEQPVDTLVIDEAQLEPSLFRAIKASVDRDRRPGRFLLTGSSRLLAAPDMADSLVGRVEAIELWPFAERELTGTRSTFVDAVLNEPEALVASTPSATGGVELDERLLRGGFPEAVRRRPERRRPWFDGYVRTTIERVVTQIADLERLAVIPPMLRLCAARTATELNATDVAAELGIPARTASAYLAHLTTVFLLRLVPAWSTNISAKVVRRPKLFISDVGLATHLLGLTPAGIDRPTAPRGPLIETLVATELQRQLSWAQTPASLWHYRDRSGVEVDLVLELPDGRIVGIEVKATSTPRAAHFRGLRFLADRLGDRFAFGVLLSAGPEPLAFGPRLAALPISALWD